MDRVRFIPNIPFFRVFANLFDFKSKTTKTEYAIDWCLLFVFKVVVLSLFVVFSDHYLDEHLYIFLIIFVALLMNIPYLSLNARMEKSIYNRVKSSYLETPFAIGKLALFITLLRAKNKIDEENPHNKRKPLKVVTGIVGVFLAIFLVYIRYFMFCDFFGPSFRTHFNTNIEDYSKELENVYGAKSMMPEIETITDYKDIKFARLEVYLVMGMGFHTNGLSLIVTYDESTYQSKKNEVLESYTFEETTISDNDGHYQLPVTKIEHRGYVFQFAANTDYSHNKNLFIKSFLSVGYDDVNYKIAYLYFYDVDLDIFATPGNNLEQAMHNFMDKNFYWFD